MSKKVYRKLEIQRLPYSRMLKSEVAQFASQTISIAEKYDLETMLLEPVFNLLLAQKPKIDILQLQHGVDPLREDIVTLKSKLMLTISDLKLKVRLISKTSYDAELHVVNSHIENYLRYLNKSKNDKQLSQKIQGFTQEFMAKQALSSAFSKHNLLENVTAITKAHENLMSKISERVSLLSERPKIATKLAIDGLTGGLNDLFKSIEVAHLTNTEVDYAALADELNQLYKMYSLTLKLRNASNKRKADADKAEQEDNLDSDADASKPETSPEGEASSEKTRTSGMSLYNKYPPYQPSTASIDDNSEASSTTKVDTNKPEQGEVSLEAPKPSKDDE